MGKDWTLKAISDDSRRTGIHRNLRHLRTGARQGHSRRSVASPPRAGGWTPTNTMITVFGVIGETPFGPLGDVMLLPDPKAEVRVDFGDGGPPEHFVLADVRNTDGSPWSCCPREFLRRALAALEREAG